MSITRTFTGLLALFLFVSSGVIAASEKGPTGKKVLAVLDSNNIKKTHSRFFANLEADGFKIDYTDADTKANFIKHGEYKYDHLVLFAPHADEFAGLDAEVVLEFIDQGGNVILAADSEASEAVKTIASECNVELDQSGAFVIDHQNYDSNDEGQHTLVAATNIITDEVVVGKGNGAPILFRGVGLDVLEDLSLLFPVISGSEHSFSQDPTASGKKKPHVSGEKTTLVAALQARNNARVLLSGSLELFSDKFFSSPVKSFSSKKQFDQSGNEELTRNAAQWTFHQRGSIRTSNATHHIVGQTESPATYTIRDNIYYGLKIEEWKGNQWVPFKSEDVQLEFIMLDPYYRIPLKGDENGIFSTEFIAPDVYGVFTFKVEFHRKGYGFVHVSNQVPVRPYRHNQYERFIPSAYPYYASAISMLCGLWVFSWVFLYTKE